MDEAFRLKLVAILDEIEKEKGNAMAEIIKIKGLKFVENPKYTREQELSLRFLYVHYDFLDSLQERINNDFGFIWIW